jgi:hypothetical protein
MAPPRILIREDDKHAQRVRGAHLAAPERAWGVVGRLGLLVGIVGLAGILLEWYPAGADGVGATFPAIVASMADLPVASLGLLAYLAAAIAQRRRRMTRRAAIVNLAVAAVVLLLMLAFGALAPDVYALAAAPSRLGLRKVVLKTALFGLGFGFIHLAAALGAWRLSRTSAADVAG